MSEVIINRGALNDDDLIDFENIGVPDTEKLVGILVSIFGTKEELLKKKDSPVYEETFVEVQVSAHHLLEAHQLLEVISGKAKSKAAFIRQKADALWSDDHGSWYKNYEAWRQKFYTQRPKWEREFDRMIQQLESGIKEEKEKGENNE